MAPTDLDDTKTNGHSDPLADAETLKLEPVDWPPTKQRSLLQRGIRLVTGRPARAAAASESGQRGMPTWLPGAVIALFLAFGGGVCGYWYKSGRVDERLEQHQSDLVKLMNERDENIRLRERVESLVRQRTELSQYVGELSMWSADVRTKLISTTRGRPIDVPPLPQRNGRGLGE